MNAIVQVEGMTKIYGAFRALNECSMQIPEGSIFGLLGPNGAGKTTLIRCLMGYLKPTSGVARIDGLDCLLKSLDIRQRVSYLPAESKLYRLMRGRDCIDFFSCIHPRGNKSLAMSIAKRLELDLSRRVAFMSTGMRQKLAICCVMSCRSKLMILDEPTANLDPTVRAEVLKIVREAQSDGVTIAFCSHVLSEIEEVCDQAAILKRGQVVHSLELKQLKFVHRVHANVTAGQQISDLDENRRMLTDASGKILLELSGPMENHLDWMQSNHLKSIQIETIGLRSIYEQYHPSYSELSHDKSTGDT